jgi:hypothetical protein
MSHPSILLQAPPDTTERILMKFDIGNLNRPPERYGVDFIFILIRRMQPPMQNKLKQNVINVLKTTRLYKFVIVQCIK